MSKKPDVVYICDGKSCGDECPNPTCHLTHDVKHAKNFMCVGDNKYVETTEEERDKVFNFYDKAKYHQVPVHGGHKSVGEIVKTMNDDQKQCLYWMVGAAIVDFYEE